MNSRNNGRIDWLALDGEAVAVTVEEIGPPKDYGYGPIPEVVCRVIVLTGPTAGAVYPAQRVTAAGIRTKLEEHPPGTELVGRVDTYTHAGKRLPSLGRERAGDMKLAEAALIKAAKEAPPPKPRAGEPDAARRCLVLRPAASFTPRPVRWAWDTAAPDTEPQFREGRFPVGSLVIAAGRAGVGKSQFAVWCTAGVTTGT